MSCLEWRDVEDGATYSYVHCKGRDRREYERLLDVMDDRYLDIFVLFSICVTETKQKGNDTTNFPGNGDSHGTVYQRASRDIML